MLSMQIVEIQSNITGSRDPKDNYLLSMSADGQADFLISGDPHLLELKSLGNTPMLTMREFLEWLAD